MLLHSSHIVSTRAPTVTTAVLVKFDAVGEEEEEEENFATT